MSGLGLIDRVLAAHGVASAMAGQPSYVVHTSAVLLAPNRGIVEDLSRIFQEACTAKRGHNAVPTSHEFHHAAPAMLVRSCRWWCAAREDLRLADGRWAGQVLGDTAEAGV